MKLRVTSTGACIWLAVLVPQGRSSSADKLWWIWDGTVVSREVRWSGGTVAAAARLADRCHTTGTGMVFGRDTRVFLERRALALDEDAPRLRAKKHAIHSANIAVPAMTATGMHLRAI